MSLANACVVRMAEIHECHAVLTLDSDFTVYRKSGRVDDGLSVDCNGRCAGEVGFYRVIALCRTEF
jgi:hypothetical protein